MKVISKEIQSTGNPEQVQSQVTRSLSSPIPLQTLQVL